MVLIPYIKTALLSLSLALASSKMPLTNPEIKMISQLVMAEAEGEEDEGKRLVIDTVLNRIDSEHFPNSVKEVIYQKNQFSCILDGRFDKSSPSEEVVKMVKEELQSRYNDDVVFFRAGRYSDYGTPEFKVGNHYFSSY